MSSRSKLESPRPYNYYVTKDNANNRTIQEYPTWIIGDEVKTATTSADSRDHERRLGLIEHDLDSQADAMKNIMQLVYTLEAKIAEYEDRIRVLEFDK